MDGKDWKKIQDNFVILTKDLQVKDIIPFLYQSRVINDDDEERLQLTGDTSQDKARTLLRILRFKKESYSPFYEALRTEQSYLADLMGAPEKSNQESNAVQESPEEFLKSNYRECEGHMTPFADVKSSLIKAYHRDWGVPELGKLVRDIFPAVRIKKHKKRPDQINFCNLQKQPRVHDGPPCRTTLSGSPDLAEPQPQSGHADQKFTGMASWNTDRLCSWMQPSLEEDNISMSVLDVIKEENIDGKVFQNMAMADMKEVFPFLTYGDRKRLELLTHKSSEAENEEQVSVGFDGASQETWTPQERRTQEDMIESLRKFDLKPTSSYKIHNIIRGKETTITNMIEPVHKFVPAQDYTGSFLLEVIANDTVQFAAACLNSRTNGSIHFGISNGNNEQHMDGEIIGIVIDEEKCLEKINEALSRDFFPDQLGVAERCVRPARFVGVVQAKDDTLLRVVEVDVVPLASLTKGDVFFLRVASNTASGQTRKTTLFMYERGDIKELGIEEIPNFMTLIERLSKARQYEEDQHLAKSRERHRADLRENFLSLFCGPTKTLDHEFYPILICGKPDQSSHKHIDPESFDFITQIDWTAVMDLDDTNTGLYSMYEDLRGKTTKTLTSDQFDPRHPDNLDDKNRLKSLQDELRTSSIPPWIFLNGYAPVDKQALSPSDWKLERKVGFEEALRFYYNEIPNDRAIILILLLSKHDKVMVEIADEICSKFKDQWMIVAEDDTIANALEDALIRRNINREALKDRCVVGIKWKHISVMMSQLHGPTTDNKCLLPTSNGTPCEMKEKVRNGLIDLDILSQSQCDIPKIPKDLDRQTEERFYRGDEVSWWNFWFKDHVCQRKEYKELLKKVQRSLEGDIKENDKVGRVYLHHQPGAGGTTTSRNVLWELKEDYRCCVLKQISDQSAKYIAKFRTYEDTEDPKPVLILIDDMDEEKVTQLYSELEEAARQTARRNDERFLVYCVLLICYRSTSVPREYQKHAVLRHELSPGDLFWFKKKSEVLEKNHNENKCVDPILLISFNILKENFNPDHIRRTVTKLLEAVTDQKERCLLKYISLINSFDLDFRLLPVANFDWLMAKNPKSGSWRVNQSWDTRLSSSITTLLNRKTTTGHSQGLRLFNALLSKDILHQLLETGSLDSGIQTVSEAMLEFLHSSIFRENGNCVTQHIVKNLIKKRASVKLWKIAQFSPVITEIVDREGMDAAATVMITAFEKTNDPMISQQIARLYIQAQNWKKAVEYAKIATHFMPYNSFVWDTYGQVYKQKSQVLYDQATSHKSSPHPLDGELIRTIEAAFEAIEKFRKEQVVSNHATNMETTNNAGYFNEVQVIMLILDSLQQVSVFRGNDTLHRFLIDPPFKRREAESCLGLETTDRLKSLYKESCNTLTFLEDELLQLKDDIYDDNWNDKRETEKNQLIKLKEKHDHFFGEGTNEVPANLGEEEASDFRRRRVIRLCGLSLRNVLITRLKPGGEDILLSTQRLLLDNIDSGYEQPFDYKTVIGVSLALSVIQSEKSLCDIRQLIDYSRKLIGMVKKDERVALEAYLYFVMLHWPTGKEFEAIRCSNSRLQTAIREWKEAFYKRYPRQRGGKPLKKKETTVFHLGKGPCLQKYTHFVELLGRQGDGLWTRPETVLRLETLSGTLTNYGKDVCIELESEIGSTSMLTIPSKVPKNDKNLWNKKVFFFLGFSSSGPKAFGITGEDPNLSLVQPFGRRPPRRDNKTQKSVARTDKMI